MLVTQLGQFSGTSISQSHPSLSIEHKTLESIMIKIQVNMTTPSLEGINKMLVALHQQPINVDLRLTPIKQFNEVFPDLTCRNHVVVHVYAMGLPESLGDLSHLLNCTPLIVSQSFHVYTVTLLELQARVQLFQSDKHYNSITSQLTTILNRI